MEYHLRVDYWAPQCAPTVTQSGDPFRLGRSSPVQIVPRPGGCVPAMSKSPWERLQMLRFSCIYHLWRAQGSNPGLGARPTHVLPSMGDSTSLKELIGPDRGIDHLFISAGSAVTQSPEECTHISE
jgi:hypothetical protein